MQPTRSVDTNPSTYPSQAPPHRQFHPDGPSSRSKTTRPAGLMGMIVVVLVMETLIGRAPKRFLDPPTYSWSFAAERARREAVPAEVLCVGDSLVKHSLIPSVITEKTGLRAENASAASAPAVWTYFVLQRALQAGSKPKVVVFDLKPSVLVGGPRFDLRRFQETLTLAECWELYRVSKSTSLGSALFLRNFPSYRARFEIREAIVSAFHGKEGKTFLLNQICERNWTVNDGANVARKHPEFQGRVSEDDQKSLLSDRFAAHKVNAAFAKKIVTLARSRSIASYLVLAPYCRAIRERRHATGAEARYEAFVRSLQELDPELTVVDARDCGYPDSVFVDPTHLDRDGAVALSHDLADLLKRDQDGGAHPPSRWVKLSEYRAWPVDPSLEDIEGSRGYLNIQLE